MAELEGIRANIKYYEDLLQTSPKHPQLQIIERLLGNERDRLSKIEAGASPVPPTAKADEGRIEDDLGLSDGPAQMVNNADPPRTMGQRVYGSVSSLLKGVPGTPLKTVH
jgi:hypothetical protein